MADYTILIQVDPHTRVFQYLNNATGSNRNARRIGLDRGVTLLNGDRLIWVLDSSLPERTFQIDFGVLNPFQMGTALSLRGSDFVASPTIRLRSKYNLNHAFKYSVSLANGWMDDPRCVPRCASIPEPPEGLTILNAKGAKTTGPDASPEQLYIDWVDETEQAIGLVANNANPTVPAGTSPGTPLAVTVKASSGNPLTATVIWQWANGQLDTQPFTLTFTAPPPGWPTTVSDPEVIALSLPPSPVVSKVPTPTPFTITTVTPDQTTNVHAYGTLVVTQ